MLFTAAIAKFMTDAILASIKAVTKSVKQTEEELKQYAENEAARIASAAEIIATQYANGKISKDEAALHMDILKNSSDSVLNAVEGLTKGGIDDAIGAAFGAIKATINQTIGFDLIS